MPGSDAERPQHAEQVRQWLQAAHGGCLDALGRLLEVCRPYCLLIAQKHLPDNLRPKMGPSDIVQETFLKAGRHFEHFEGQSEEDLLAWLRRILLNSLANLGRQFLDTDKRRASRELALPRDDSQDRPLDWPDARSAPEEPLIAEEELEALHAALGQLSEAHRQVIRWRNYEVLPFEEIGRRLGRSAEAVRKLWARAVMALQKILEAKA
jgi:RNA polymerase sigma-70 factor (ECF subfamily)